MRKSPIAIDKESIRKRKETFAELIGQGLSPNQAGKNVGMKRDGIDRYMKDPVVKEILKKIHQKNISALQMTREKVQDIVLEAVDMGRTIGDPLAMIRGAQEINKMCGFYAAEETKIILTTEQRRTITQFDDMSDEDIVKMLDTGDMTDVIEAEFSEIAVNE